MTRLILQLTCALACTVSNHRAAETVAFAPSLIDQVADLFDDPVIARGKGVTIKQSDLEKAFIAYKANLASRGQTLGEDQRGFREAQLLDRLITTQLLINRATAEDQTKAKELAQKFTEQSIKGAASEEAFYRQLKAMGLSQAQFDKRVQEQALAEVVVERELKSTISITDAQVEEFYKTGSDALVKIMQEELERLAKDPGTAVATLTSVKGQVDNLRKSNLARLEQPERVRVAHIYLASRNRETEEELPADQKRAKLKQIEQLLARARSGEDFSQLIQQHSEDRGAKETKGEYTFSRNDNFTAEFKAASFSLTNGQISEIVTTIFGYHIIKLLERIPAKKLELEKAAPEIRDHLLQQTLQQKMPAYFARLKKEAGVEVLEPKYRLSAPVTEK